MNIYKIEKLIPRQIRPYFGLALHVGERVTRAATLMARDAVDQSFHLSKISTNRAENALHEAVEARKLAENLGDHTSFDQQTFLIARIHAGDVLRHSWSGDHEKAHESVGHLIQNLELLGKPSDLSVLGLTLDEQAIIVPYLAD